MSIATQPNASNQPEAPPNYGNGYGYGMDMVTAMPLAATAGRWDTGAGSRKREPGFLPVREYRFLWRADAPKVRRYSVCHDWSWDWLSDVPPDPAAILVVITTDDLGPSTACHDER